MKIDLANKNAVVCGSSQGIGKAIAMQFAKLGASVTLIARDEGSLKKVLSELDSSHGQTHQFIVVDFSMPHVLETKIAEYVSEYSPVHILVNNSGGPKPGEIYKAEPEDFEEGFRKHVICSQILVQALAEGMKKENYGRIINIISTSVKQPIERLGVSNTIRAAMASWAKTLSRELAPFGITVNNILPGATDTERLSALIQARSKDYGISIEQARGEWLNQIPAGRFAKPEELAFAAAFLASPYASYINGINLPVDGGRLNSL